jgi:hypothetical protein
MSETMTFDTNVDKTVVSTKPGSAIRNGKRNVQQMPSYRLAKEALELDHDKRVLSFGTGNTVQYQKWW